MGANIIPTMKKRGRTVFGVRMGLLPRCQFWEGNRKAAVDILPGF
jgi:hypothetical protein